VELELKEGAPQALLAAALHLAAPRRTNATDTALALLPAGRSKAARGHALVHGERPAPVKADAAALMRGVTAAMNASAALQNVAGNAAAVLIANAEGVLESDDPEFVHQARVALRRLRAAVSLLRAHVAFPVELADELRWTARALGAARDADVFAETTLPRILQAVADDEAAARMGAAAQRRRRQARNTARAALASPRFALLVLRLMAWSLDTIAAGATPGIDGAAAAHASGENAAAGAREDIALPAVAAAVLEAAHGKLMRLARRFRKRSPAKRHRVRIAAKRLRYALDMFAVVLPAAAKARFVRRLASLQDALGAMNDAVVARHMLATLARRGGLREWLERADAHLQEMEARHIDDAARQLARLRGLLVPLPQE
jgi:CHAD domain-containing protein